jgi:HEAT repeat protein
MSGPTRTGVIGLGVAALLAGCAGGGSGGNGGAPASGARPSAPGRAPAGDAAEPLSLVERSELRERAIVSLETFAFDEWALLRANAIEGLIQAPARVEPVARAGLADRNLGVRYAAAMTVGALRLEGSATAVEALLRDENPSVRAAAMFALARLGGRVDLTPMARWLVSGDARQRMRVAFILGELGDPSAVPLLRDVARRLNDVEGETMPPPERRLLRLQIAEALAKLGDRRSVHMLRAALYPGAGDEFEGAVLAAQALGELRDQESAAQLVVLVESRFGQVPGYVPDAEGEFLYPIEIRLAAARSLAMMGFRDGGFVADEAAEAEAEAVRAQAAFVYGAIGGPGSVRRLAALMEDASPLVRLAGSAAMLEALGSGAPG